MCGRYSSTKAPKDLADEFRAVDATDGAKVADFNVAPTKQVVAVVERHPRDEEGTPDPERVERSLRMLRWGLVPSWSKDPSGGARMINARSRRLRRSRRSGGRSRPGAASSRPTAGTSGSAVPRKGSTQHKQPYFTHYRDGSSIALAGLWEYWKPKDDPEGEYAGRAGHLRRAHHGRRRARSRRCTTGCRWCCPPSAWEAWLDPDRTPDDEAVAALLAPPSPELVAQMELRPVSPRVNNVRNNGPELLEALPPEQVAEPLQLDLLAGPNPQ